jgi:type II secretory pathway pseudopilin PulG
MRAAGGRPGGFTLVELVLVMLVISGGLIGLATVFGGSYRSLSANETLQQAAQYAQECAERVLSVRRDLGFTSTGINSTMCDSPAMAAGFTRTVTVPATTTGTGTTACPSGTTCREVTVAVTNGSLSSSVSVLLVNY